MHPRRKFFHFVGCNRDGPIGFPLFPFKKIGIHLPGVQVLGQFRLKYIISEICKDWDLIYFFGPCVQFSPNLKQVSDHPLKLNGRSNQDQKFELAQENLPEIN